MESMGIGTLLAVLAVLASFSAYRHRREIWARVDSPLTAAFIFMVPFVYTMPIFFSAFANSRSIEVNEYGLSSSASQYPATELQPYAEVTLTGFCALIVLSRFVRQTGPVQVGKRGVLALILGAVTLVGALYASEPILSLANVCFISVLVATCFLSGGVSAVVGGAGYTVYVAVCSGVISLVNPEQVLVQCERKCSAFGSVYYGLFLNENALGLVLAIGIALVWFSTKKSTRYILSTLLVLSLLATGSRTAIFAGLISILLLALFVRDVEEGVRGARFLRIVVTACALLWPVSLLVTSIASQLTGRPVLWDIALRYFAANPIFGWGAARWPTISHSGGFDAAARYSAHNQFYDVAFVGGIIAVAIFYILFMGPMWSTDRQTSVASTVMLLPVALMGFTERPMAIGSLDWLSFTYLILLLISPQMVGEKDRARPRRSIGEYGAKR